MNQKQLTDILIELSSASKKITNHEQLLAIIDRYDMIFAGKSFNCINTIDLRHTIDKIFHLSINLEELNSLIPTVCAELSMEIVPFVNAIDPTDKVPYCYQIFL